MAEVSSISPADAGGVQSASAGESTTAAEDAALLSAGMDNYIMNCVFFTFSTMQSIVSEGMRQNTAFLAETQVQDGND